MKTIPTEISTLFQRQLNERSIVQAHRNDYLKWLRFYLDFCEKYRHDPEESESLSLFLNKLASKNQSQVNQAQAVEAIKIYYSLVDHKTTVEVDSVLAKKQLAWEKCLELLKEEIRLRQYSPRTLQTYSQWTRQFMRFIKLKDPALIDSEDARSFLSHLATNKQVAASTQNQAFNALLFFYRHVIKADYDLKDKVVRAKKTKYIPVVLSRAEIDRIISHLPYPHNLAIKLMYGCGLRLFECLNLRVQCINLDESILTVHDGKGKKDRTLPLPLSLMEELEDHLRKVENLHQIDLSKGYNGVFMPTSLDRKWKSAATELGWQWIFPAKTLTLIPETGEHRRYHLHESQLQKSLRRAKQNAKISKRVTSHIFRHSFASHLLQANYDIRTIQEMLGHSDVRTTMIYTHTVKSKTQKERTSPLDFLPSTTERNKGGKSKPPFNNL